MRKFYLAIPFAVICLSLASAPELSLSKAAENDEEASSSSDWRNDDLNGGFVDEEGLVEENAPYLSTDYLHIELGNPALVEICGVPGNRWVDVERNSAYINIEKVDDNRQIYEVSLNYNDYNGQSSQYAHESGQIDFLIDDLILSLSFDLELGYYQDGLFDFKLSADETEYTLTGVNELPTNITKVAIPAYYQGLPVTEIGSWAFEDFSADAVVVPSTVKSIGVSAFESAELKGIFLTEGLERIGDRAFYQASIEEELSLPRSLVYIGDDAFRYLTCPHLYFASDEDSAALRFGTIDFASSAITYSAYRFGIGFYRLEEDFTLSLVAINSLISGRLFVPRSVRSYPVKRIGDGVNPIAPAFDDNRGTFFSDPVFAEGVEEIADNAFRNLGSSYEFPSSVKKVGERAFAFDMFGSNSNKLVFNGTLEEVGAYAFSHSGYFVCFAQSEPGKNWDSAWDSTVLKENENSYSLGPVLVFNYVGMSNGPDDGVGYAFAEKGGERYAIAVGGSPSSLKAMVTDPATGEGVPLKEIAPYAFAYSYDYGVSLPEGIERIGDYAFANATFFHLILPSSLKYVGEGAFLNDENNYYGDDHPYPIFVHSGAQTVEMDAFKGNRVFFEGAELPTGWSNLTGEWEFHFSCDYINRDGFEFIADITRQSWLLSGPKAGDIDLPTLFPNYSFVEIREKCFENAEITSFNAGDSLQAIGFDAFRQCQVLTSFDFGSSVKEIGETAFSSSGLLSAVIESDSLKVGTQAFLFSSLREVRLTGLNGEGALGASLFSGCADLKSATLLGDSLVVSSSLFYNCANLKTVRLDDSTVSIGYAAFEGCSSLSDFSLPSGLKTIEERAFYQTTVLPSCDFSNVESIGREAFYLSATGSSITVSLSSLAEGSFSGSYIKEATIIGEGDVLPAAFTFCENLEKIDFPSSVKVIDGSFAYSGLQEFDCPESLEEIQNGFTRTKLTTFQAGSSLRIIGDSSFYECVNLQAIDLSGVRTIGDLAFNREFRNESRPYCNVFLSSDLQEVGDRAFDSTCIIYCEFEENEVPAGFSEDWDVSNPNVRYGATYEDFLVAVAKDGIVL